MDTTDNSTSLDKPKTEKKGKSQRETILLAVGLALLVLIALGLPRLTDLPISGRFQTFVTIFLGIFIEAIPFLLFGRCAPRSASSVPILCRAIGRSSSW